MIVEAASVEPFVLLLCPWTRLVFVRPSGVNRDSALTGGHVPATYAATKSRNVLNLTIVGDPLAH